MKTDCRPKRLRKYHESEDTHRTSRSLVATPDWSIDLKRRVRGKGSFTVETGVVSPASILKYTKWQQELTKRGERNIPILGEGAAPNIV